ncbi:MAG: LysM peptidoglycan-binding domain-containing protein [Gammaproteobacteria bacterium]|nr:LysM peptidoglycan-binding domain-containing protein [Gammaproteobacteria bacterium]MDH3468033.1 LysM peptidoglycan-binding domain-containing protein [Gammaproteobacteria bacterium]
MSSVALILVVNACTFSGSVVATNSSANKPVARSIAFLPHARFGLLPNSPTPPTFAHFSALPVRAPGPFPFEPVRFDPVDAAPNLPNRVPVYDNVWDRIRSGLALPELDSKYVSAYEQAYSKQPDYLRRVFERARPFLPYIVEQVAARGFPLEVALLPVIESAFRPKVRSRAGAEGMWQFIAATGKRHGLRQNWWYDGRHDVIESTGAALDYLQFLQAEFNGDWFLALAAYNGGENRVARALSRNRKQGKPLEFTALKLHSETHRYVPKLIAVRNIIADPEAFGVVLPDIPNRQSIAVIDAESQIDFAIVSTLAHVPLEALLDLNPGYKRRATPPNGPHRIVVPATHQQQLIAGLANLSANERLRWAGYRVRSGDVLGKIAHKYGVSVREIRDANHLTSDLIRPGQSLIVPLSAQTLSAAAIDPPAIGDRHTYRVARGDTLWSIARRYRVYVSQLIAWNSIDASTVLQLGQKLVINPN